MGKEQSAKQILNDKVNESMKITSSNLNESLKSMKRKSVPKIGYTEYVADKLVGIFNAPQSRKFFLKCAWNLPEDTIWSAVEDSKKKGVNSAIALFIFICNNALQELPVKK